MQNKKRSIFFRAGSSLAPSEQSTRQDTDHRRFEMSRFRRRRSQRANFSRAALGREIMVMRPRAATATTHAPCHPQSSLDAYGAPSVGRQFLPIFASKSSTFQGFLDTLPTASDDLPSLGTPAFSVLARAPSSALHHEAGLSGLPLKPLSLSRRKRGR